MKRQFLIYNTFWPGQWKPANINIHSVTVYIWVLIYYLFIQVNPTDTKLIIIFKYCKRSDCLVWRTVVKKNVFQVLLTLANSQIGSMQMLVGLPAVSGLLLGPVNNIVPGRAKVHGNHCSREAKFRGPAGAYHVYLTCRLLAPAAWWLLHYAYSWSKPEAYVFHIKLLRAEPTVNQQSLWFKDRLLFILPFLYFY